MGQILKIKAAGLHTFASEYSAVPEGSLKIADNIIIDQEGLMSPRRGLTSLDAKFGGSEIRANSIYEYQDKILLHYNDNTLAFYDDSLSTPAWEDLADIGTNKIFNAPDYDAITNKNIPTVRSSLANGNFYFTTDKGVKKLEAYNADIYDAGIVQATGMTLALQSATGGGTEGTGVWFTESQQVAYRIVWGFVDANENLILGTPSERAIITNPAADPAPNTANVTVTVTIPIGITSQHVLQVYRSGLSGGLSVEPNDSLQLVYEANPSSTEIDDKALSFVDKSDDTLRGAELYTSPGQEGIENANGDPPLCRDMASFNNHMFFANVRGRHTKQVTLVSVDDASGGLEAGDTVIIVVDEGGSSEVTLTFEAAAATDATASPPEFKLVTGGSVAANIADTARELVKCINTAPGQELIYAYYNSGPEDLPGRMIVQRRDFTDESLTLRATYTNEDGGFENPPQGGTTYYHVGFSPQLPYTDEITDANCTQQVISENNNYQHGVYFSKPNQPESVPLLQVLFAGSKNSAITRIASLKDSLFIFKDEGIFRLTGVDKSSFQVELFDSSTELVAPNSLAVLNNQIYCLTTQGVVSITDGGVEVVSRPIEREFTQFSTIKSTMAAHCFGIGYETERKYLIFIISTATDTFSTQAFCFNVFTRTWTRFDLSGTCGSVLEFADKMYLGRHDSNQLREERKNLDHTDYVDDSYLLNITSQDGVTVGVDDSTNIEVGDILYQSDTKWGVVRTIDHRTKVATLGDTSTFGVAAGALLPSSPGLANVKCLSWNDYSGTNAYSVYAAGAGSPLGSLGNLSNDGLLYLGSNFGPPGYTGTRSSIKLDNNLYWVADSTSDSYTWKGHTRFDGRPKDPWSVSFWVKGNGTDTYDRQHAIFEKGRYNDTTGGFANTGDSGSHCYITIYIKDGAFHAAYNVENRTGGSGSHVDNGGIMFKQKHDKVLEGDDTQWHNVTVTWDGTKRNADGTTTGTPLNWHENSFKIWVNGHDDSTISSVNSANPGQKYGIAANYDFFGAPGSGVNSATNGDHYGLTIGDCAATSGTEGSTLKFKGLIHSVATFDYALDDDTTTNIGVRTLYRKGPKDLVTNTGLVNWWRFDDVDTESGNDHHLWAAATDRKTIYDQGTEGLHLTTSITPSGTELFIQDVPYSAPLPTTGAYSLANESTAVTYTADGTPNYGLKCPHEAKSGVTNEGAFEFTQGLVSGMTDNEANNDRQFLYCRPWKDDGAGGVEHWPFHGLSGEKPGVTDWIDSTEDEGPGGIGYGARTIMWDGYARSTALWDAGSSAYAHSHMGETFSVWVKFDEADVGTGIQDIATLWHKAQGYWSHGRVPAGGEINFTRAQGGSTAERYYTGMEWESGTAELRLIRGQYGNQNGGLHLTFGSMAYAVGGQTLYSHQESDAVGITSTGTAPDIGDNEWHQITMCVSYGANSPYWYSWHRGYGWNAHTGGSGMVFDGAGYSVLVSPVSADFVDTGYDGVAGGEGKAIYSRANISATYVGVQGGSFLCYVDGQLLTAMSQADDGNNQMLAQFGPVDGVSRTYAGNNFFGGLQDDVNGTSGELFIPGFGSRYSKYVNSYTATNSDDYTDGIKYAATGGTFGARGWTGSMDNAVWLGVCLTKLQTDGNYPAFDTDPHEYVQELYNSGKPLDLTTDSWSSLSTQTYTVDGDGNYDPTESATAKVYDADRDTIFYLNFEGSFFESGQPGEIIDNTPGLTKGNNWVMTDAIVGESIYRQDAILVGEETNHELTLDSGDSIFAADVPLFPGVGGAVDVFNLTKAWSIGCWMKWESGDFRLANGSIFHKGCKDATHTTWYSSAEGINIEVVGNELIVVLLPRGITPNDASGYGWIPDTFASAELYQASEWYPTHNSVDGGGDATSSKEFRGRFIINETANQWGTADVWRHLVISYKPYVDGTDYVNEPAMGRQSIRCYFDGVEISARTEDSASTAFNQGRIPLSEVAAGTHNLNVVKPFYVVGLAGGSNRKVYLDEVAIWDVGLDLNDAKVLADSAFDLRENRTVGVYTYDKKDYVSAFYRMGDGTVGSEIDDIGTEEGVADGDIIKNIATDSSHATYDASDPKKQTWIADSPTYNPPSSVAVVTEMNFRETDSFSISWFMYLDNDATNGVFFSVETANDHAFYIFSKGTDILNGFWVLMSDQGLKCTLQSAGVTKTETIFTLGSLESRNGVNGDWDHYCLTYSFASQFKLYVNNTEITGSDKLLVNSNASDVNNKNDLVVGGTELERYSGASAPHQHNFPGLIDDLAVYNKELASIEIPLLNEETQVGIEPADLSALPNFENCMGWWRFDSTLSPADAVDGTGNTVFGHETIPDNQINDRTGNQRHGNPDTNFNAASADIVSYVPDGVAAQNTTLLKSIKSVIEYNPITGDNPGMLKQFSEATNIFKESFTNDAVMGFQSDLSFGFDDVTVSNSGLGAYGMFAWGNASWGGVTLAKNERTWVPKEKQKGTHIKFRFNHSNGFGSFKLAGLSLKAREISQRSRR